MSTTRCPQRAADPLSTDSRVTARFGTDVRRLFCVRLQPDSRVRDLTRPTAAECGVAVSAGSDRLDRHSDRPPDGVPTADQARPLDLLLRDRRALMVDVRMGSGSAWGTWLPADGSFGWSNRAALRGRVADPAGRATESRAAFAILAPGGQGDTRSAVRLQCQSATADRHRGHRAGPVRVSGRRGRCARLSHHGHSAADDPAAAVGSPAEAQPDAAPTLDRRGAR